MDKKEFDLKKKIIELDHKNKMDEILAQRENNRLFHERELERGRIKSAEIRKSQLRKFGDPYKC